MSPFQTLVGVSLLWLVLTSTYVYGWMIGRHTATPVRRTAPAAIGQEDSDEDLPPLRLIDLTDHRPRGPYDWATADSGLSGCGLCYDTGHATFVDPITGSGIVGGVCPCGIVPAV